MDLFMREGPIERDGLFGIPQVIGIFDEPHMPVANVQENFLADDVQTLIQRPHKSDSLIFTKNLWGTAWIMKQHNMQIYNAIAQFDPTGNPDGNDPYHNVSLDLLHKFIVIHNTHELEYRLPSLRYPMTLFLQNLILQMNRLLIVLLVMRFFKRMLFLLVKTNHQCPPT
jgi:hypothetical protein